MDELNTQNVKPLLIVKYVWWRMFYTQIAYFIGIGLGFIGYISFTQCSTVLGWLFSFSLMVSGLLGIYGTFELLFFKEFRFYKDRIEKCFYLFGIKQLYFHDNGLIRNGSFFDYFIFFSNKKRFRFLFIPIYLIGTGKDYSKIVNVLALISGRTIQEIEDISLYGENLQYFLLSEAQKISSNSLK